MTHVNRGLTHLSATLSYSIIKDLANMMLGSLSELVSRETVAVDLIRGQHVAGLAESYTRDLTQLPN